MVMREMSDRLRESLRNIASFPGDDIMKLRNMAARALGTLDGEEDRFSKEQAEGPVLVVSSSVWKLKLFEYRHRGDHIKYIISWDIHHCQGIDTRTPVVLVEPVNKELREFVKIRFTKVTKCDMM